MASQITTADIAIRPVYDDSPKLIHKNSDYQNNVSLGKILEKAYISENELVEFETKFEPEEILGNKMCFNHDSISERYMARKIVCNGRLFAYSIYEEVGMNYGERDYKKRKIFKKEYNLPYLSATKETSITLPKWIAEK